MPAARLRWIILALLCASTAINYIDRQALAVLLPKLREDLGITSSEYGTITTLFLIAYTLAQIVGGMLIDRLGTRAGFVLFLVAWSLAAAGHALAAGALSLAALRFLLGLSEAGNWPAGGKAVAEWFPRECRAFAMGIFDGGSALGAILAQPLVASLAIAFGWRAAFVATGALGFFWVAGWLLVYRHPAEHPWLDQEQRRMVLAQTAGAGRQAGGGMMASLRPLIGQRQLWGLMLTRMLATPVWWFYVFWLPDYLASGRGFSLREIGMFGWIPFLTVDLGKLAGGSLSDRLLAAGRSATVARKSVMAAGALAMIAGVEVVGAPNAAMALTWISVATFGFGMWSANILALHADVFPASSMATAVGWTGTAASFGGAIFTFFIGRLVETSGYAPVFGAAAAVTVLSFLSLVFVLGKVERIHVRELSTQ